MTKRGPAALPPVPEPTLTQVYGAILSMARALDRMAGALDRLADLQGGANERT